MFRFDLVEVIGGDLEKLFSFDAEWQVAYQAFPGIAREYFRMAGEKPPGRSLQCYIFVVEEYDDSRVYPVHSLVWTATRASDVDPPKILIRPGPIMLAAMTKADRQHADSAITASGEDQPRSAGSRSSTWRSDATRRYRTFLDIARRATYVGREGESNVRIPRASHSRSRPGGRPDGR